MTSRKRARATSTSTDDSDVAAIRFESADLASDQDRLPRRPKGAKSLAGAHDREESQDESSGPRRRRKATNAVLDSDDDSPPPKRKLVKGKRPPTPNDDDDDDDGDMLAENEVIESRLRSRGRMSAFQRHLEKLKTLKGLKKRDELVLSSSEESERSDSSSANVLFKGAKPHDDSDAEDEDDDDDDDEGFIVDDNDGAMQLPLAFSLSTHQDLTHQFKIVCQFFVHLAVQPLADRRSFFERALKEEEYLSVPLQVTRRKLSGMRDSLVASSVWKSDFRKALETYPEFSLFKLDFTIPNCDACNLGGRKSTLRGQLVGNPYDAYDFEDVSDDESSSSEEDAVRVTFHLGRFCAARTRLYHEFCHWEHSLYTSLRGEITTAQDGRRGFVQVAYFGGIEPPRDVHDADRMMEWLDERGIIEREWQKVRQMMDGARNLDRAEVDA